MQYPHWLMIGGGVLVVLGFFGFVFHKNAEPDEDTLEQEIGPPEERAQLSSRPTRRPPELREDRVDPPGAEGSPK
jgi:hypothetical protein